MTFYSFKEPNLSFNPCLDTPFSCSRQIRWVPKKRVNHSIRRLTISRNGCMRTGANTVSFTVSVFQSNWVTSHRDFIVQNWVKVSGGTVFPFLITFLFVPKNKVLRSGQSILLNLSPLGGVTKSSTAVLGSGLIGNNPFWGLKRFGSRFGWDWLC